MHSMHQNNPQLQQYLQLSSGSLLPGNTGMMNVAGTSSMPGAGGSAHGLGYRGIQQPLAMPDVIGYPSSVNTGATASMGDSMPGTSIAGNSAAASFGFGSTQYQVRIPQADEEKIYQLILDLSNPVLREQALLELSKKREQFDDLALILWYSFGVMAILLQEITSVYPALNPESFNTVVSNRVCNALALLQCVASHNETRSLLLNAHIPLYLYPFLNSTYKPKPFEYLRLTSLGVIGALVKNDNPEVIQFLLSTEIIPLCLRIMETGSELSKTVAIFIIQKILMDDVGLAYICQTYERFYAVTTVLNNMVTAIIETQAVRLLKHIIRCYLRLSDNPRAREALRQCLPEALRDASFSEALKDDGPTKRCLAQLLVNLSDNVVTTS